MNFDYPHIGALANSTIHIIFYRSVLDEFVAINALTEFALKVIKVFSFPFLLLRHGNDFLKFIFYFQNGHYHFDRHLYSKSN